MLLNGSKLKFLNNNIQTTSHKRKIYPYLNKLNFEKLNGSNTISNNSKKNFNRPSSSFMKRNYESYLNKVYHNKSLNNKSMINLPHLNSILFDLKQNYNDLLIYNQKHANKIENLLKDTRELKESLYIITEKRNKIELQNEDVIIYNYNKIKSTKEELENKMYALIKKKKSIDILLQNQIDYNQTLVYLMECEKNNYVEQKKDLGKILEKIRTIKRCQKVIDDYMIKNEKGEKDYNILKNKIFGNIKLVGKINGAQSLDIEKINNEIKEKEFDITILEDKVKELEEKIKQEIDLPKKELKEKVQKAKEFKKKKLRDDKKHIEIINCLFLIQKQIYENNDMDDKKNKNLEIKDYQVLNQSNKLNKENKSQISQINSLNLNNKSTLFESINFKDNKKIKTFFKNKRKKADDKNIKKILSKTTSTVYKTLNDFNSMNESKNNLSVLVNKFNNIKITKNEIFDYINNLESKSEFYRTQMSLLHNKEINLENLKNTYNTKAKNIISNNFFNFDELTKNNEKCKEFLEQNELYLTQKREAEEKLKKNIILDKIKQNSKIDNTKRKNNDEEKINNNSNIFQDSRNLIHIIRSFILISSDILKNICKSERDTENNPYIKVLEKINEFYQNEDVYISKDYKLLLQYIKNLIKFCKEKGDVLPKDALEEINSDLFNKFYKPGEINKKLDKEFINQFMTKKNKNYNNIFIHFTELVDPVIDIIKSIYNLIASNENENINIINNYNEDNENKIIERRFSSISPKSKRNNRRFNNLNSLKYENKSAYLSAELCKDEEDIEKTVKIDNAPKNKRSKWRIKLLDKKIVDKLYEPYMAKILNLRRFNSNIPNIKMQTNLISKINNQILKKIEEVNNISRKMRPYENPDIDTNKLNNDTYNSLIKLIKDNNYNNNKNNYMSTTKNMSLYN